MSTGKMAAFLFVFLVLCVGETSAQTKEDSADKYCRLAKETVINDPEKALGLARKSLALYSAKTPANKHAALYQVAVAYKNLGAYDSSLFYYKTCYENRREQSAILQAEPLNGMGIVYALMGKFERSLDYFLKAQAIYESVGDSASMARGYNNIANNYYSTSDNEKALVYYLRAMGIKQRHNFREGLSSSLINVSGIYIEKKEFEKAKIYLDTVLKYARAKNDLQNLSMAYAKMGRLFFYKKDFRTAAKYAQEAIAIREKQGDLYGIANCLIELGEAYSFLGDSKKAIESYERGMQYARETRALEHLKELCDRLSAEYLVKGDYKNAYHYLWDHMHYCDSINNEKTAARIDELREKYEVREKEKNIQKLNLEKAGQELELYKKKTLINYILVISAIVILGILLLYYRYSLKQKNITLQREKLLNEERIAAIEEKRMLQEKQQKEILNVMIQAQEEERRKIAIDLHDGLGQLLSGIKLKLELVNTESDQSDRLRQTVDQIRSLNAEAITESKTIASNLLPYNIKDHGLVTALKNLCYSSNLASGGHVKFFSKDVPRKLLPELETAVYRIAQELLNNALKHSGATEIFVQLFFRDGCLILQVEDNGRGFDLKDASNRAGSMGLKNIGIRVQLLDGNLSIDSTPDHGTITIVEFPCHD